MIERLRKIYKKYFLWHLRERRYTTIGWVSPKGYDSKTVNKDGQMEYHRKVKQ